MKLLEHIMPRRSGLASMVHIYTDGGCSNNGQESAKAAWGWLCKETGDKESGRVEGKQSNNTGELTAIIKALDWATRTGHLSVTIFSDSQYAIKCIVGVWRRKKNVELFEQIDALAMPLHRIHFEWVRGHDGCYENEVVDSLCRKELGLAAPAEKPLYSYAIGK